MTTSNSDKRAERRRAAFVAAVVSVLVHVLLLIVLGPRLLSAPEELPPLEPFELELVEEDAPPEEVVEEVIAARLEPERAEDDAPEVSEPPAALPEQRAATTPEPPRPSPPDPPATAPEQILPSPVPDPVVLAPSPVEPAPAALFPTMKSYDTVMREFDDALPTVDPDRPRLFADYEARSEALKKSLMGHGTAVRPGNHTGVESHRSVYGSYLGRMHHKIHPRWAHAYLGSLDAREPPGSPLNDPNLNTKLELVINAGDGAVEAVNIVRSSGQLRFDAEAIAVAHAIGKHPNPPPEIVSPDGRVYIHWNFWRNQRQCGLFGASVFLVHTERG